MGSVRRHGVTAAALALALLLGGCADGPRQPSMRLRAGVDTLDGTLPVWPARGGLATDDRAIATVSRAVADWRSPEGDRVYLPASGILWLGEAEGGRLGLVAASVPGNGASWLLQLTGSGDDVAVDRAVEYTDPGYLVYSDVLPVQLPSGRHYLTSARVDRLLGPTGDPVPISDGLTDRVDVPRCTSAGLTVALRVTESLPQGKPADRLVDLGTATADPRYPLVGDDANTARKALAGLDTCALATETGPFGSIERRILGKPAPTSAPASWPIDRVTTRSLGDVMLGTAPAAGLDQLTWRTDSGTMTSVALRPAEGTPVTSRADRSNPLQLYELTVDGQKYVALTWRAAPDSSISLPSETLRAVDRPGLVIIPKPADPQTFSLVTPDRTYYRSVEP